MKKKKGITKEGNLEAMWAHMQTMDNSPTPPEGWVNISEFAERIGKSEVHARTHLTRMLKKGSVERKKVGAKYYYNFIE